MKVAFDVKGTLVGNRQERVLKLFHWFQTQGAEMFVWSNVYSFADDAVRNLNLNATPMSKDTKNDFYEIYDLKEKESRFMDYAIEDDKEQTYLAAKKFIWVSDIPENEEEFPAFVASIGENV